MAEPRITARGLQDCDCARPEQHCRKCVGRDYEREAFDALVDEFAAEVKAKFLASRKKGRFGWDAEDWSRRCKAMLHEHIHKGDARDVGVLAAFLFNMRGV